MNADVGSCGGRGVDDPKVGRETALGIVIASLAALVWPAVGLTVEPPANDQFAHRESLAGSTAQVSTTNVGATAEEGEPNHAGAGASHSLWWTWTADVSGGVVIDTQGSRIDTVLAVYEGLTLSELAPVAANDDASEDRSSRVRFATRPGATYQIAVDGFDAEDAGEIVLRLQSIPLDPPANDNFADRLPLIGSSASAEANNEQATREFGEPQLFGEEGDRSVWWSWTASGPGLVYVDTLGSDFDTVLYVYTGEALEALEVVEANDDAEGVTSRVVFRATGDTAYQIAVDGFGPDEFGSVQLHLRHEEVAATANDDFAEREELTGVAGEITTDTSMASREPGEPAHAGQEGERSLWWWWTAPRTGELLVRTAGSAFDTVLAVYQGETLETLELVAANDDASAETVTSQVRVLVEGESTYVIAADGYDAEESGLLNLAYEWTELTRPGNDDFANRHLLTGTSSSVQADNRYASREPSEPAQGASTGIRSLWWSWTTADVARVVVDTTGSDFDTVLSVYRGESLEALELVVFNDDEADELLTSRAWFEAEGGGTYQISVDGYEPGEFGTIRLNLEATPQVRPPNDRFSDRIALSGPVSFVDGNSGFATAEPGEPAHLGLEPGRSVWWSWTAADAGGVTIQALSGDFDPILAVYRGEELEALEFLGGNDGTPGVRLYPRPGEVLQIAVTGESAEAGGEIELMVGQFVPQPPVNDDFADRVSLAGSTAETTVDNTDASREAGEPYPGRFGGRSVWWSWTAPDAGAVVISTAGSAFDTVLTVLQGTELGQLRLIAANDDYDGLTSRVALRTVPGEVYQIQVDGFGPNEFGEIRLGMEAVDPAVLSNDAFVDRIFLAGESVTATGESREATRESGEPDHAGGDGEHSLWWGWYAPGAGEVVVSTAGSPFDTVLAVYQGSSVSDLQLLSANDDAATAELTSRVRFTTQPRARVWIAVDGYDPDDYGEVNLSLEYRAILPPENDRFENRSALAGPEIEVEGNSTDAGSEEGEPEPVQGKKTVWWSWTASDLGGVRIEVESESFGPVVAVYRGENLESLELVEFREPWDVEPLVFRTEAGAVYQIAVAGDEPGTGGGFRLRLEEFLSRPPGNDDFVNRAPLAGTVAAGESDTTNATAEPGEPSHADQDGAHSVWWSWRAPGDGEVLVETTGSAFDTTLAVYLGDSLAELELVAANDDAADSRTSQLTFEAEQGVVYQLAVDGYDEEEHGPVILSLALTIAVPPENDDFAGSVLPSAPEASGTADSTYATAEPDEPGRVFGSGGHSVWWSWTAPTSTGVEISTAGSDFDTVLDVYRQEASETFRLVAANDDYAQGDLTSRVRFVAEAEAVYHIRVDGFDLEDFGTVQLGIRSLDLTPPPNDSFDGRFYLTGNQLQVEADNTDATIELDEPDHFDGFGMRSLWWSWVASDLGTVEIGTAGSGFLAGLAVYEGETLADLARVGFDFREEGSQVRFHTQPGATYHIAVDGVGPEDFGIVRLNLQTFERVQPANDDFAGRFSLTGSMDSARADNSDASLEVDDPLRGYGGRTLWWTWTAATADAVEIDTEGSSFDTVLAVFEGESLANLARVARNDDAGDETLTSRVRFTTRPGEVYQIVVDGFDRFEFGELAISLRVASLVRPPNDDFADRLVLIGPNASAAGDNTDASPEEEEPYHLGELKNRSVWWSWTASDQGGVWISLDGTSFDAVLSVYRGEVLGELVRVADDYDSAETEVSFSTESGKTYQIAVDTPDPQEVGSISLRIEEFVPEPPLNDLFANRIPLTGSMVEVTGSNRDAGREPGEPNHANRFGNKSVWWSWTAPESLVTRIGTEGSVVNTVLAVYRGEAVDDLRLVVDDDDSGGQSASRVEFVAEAGVVYQVAVDGFEDRDAGALSLSIEQLAQPVPANDRFVNRAPAELQDGTLQVVADNSVAGRDPDEPVHAHVAGVRSLWWSWTASAAGRFLASTAGSDFDTVLAVYTGTNLQDLNEIASDDDSGELGTSQVAFDCQAGVTYFIAVDGYRGAGGEVRLNLAFNDAPIVQLETPSFGQIFASPADIRLQALATDADGIDRVEFSRDGELLAVVNRPPFSLVDRQVHAGTCLYEARAIDVLGVPSRPAAVTVTVVPPNDAFAAAEVIGGLEAQATGANVAATVESNEPDHAGLPPERSVWWRWIASEDGEVLITTAGSDFDTVLAVYTGEILEQLVEVAASDDTDLGDAAAVRFLVRSGTEYRIAVGGYGGAEGRIRLRLRVNQPPLISVSSPADGASLPGPATVDVAVKAIDPDGRLKRVELLRNELLLATMTSRPFTFTWPNVSPGEYRLSARAIDDQNSVTESRSVRFRVTGKPGPPVVLMEPEDLILPEGETASFQVAAEGTPPLQYQWYAESRAIPGATGPEFVRHDVGPADAGSYEVRVSNEHGSATSRAVELTVLRPPRILVHPESQIIPAGQPGGFSVVAEGPEPLNFQWHYNGVPLPGETEADLRLAAVRAVHAGRYAVTVSNEAGFETSGTAALAVEPSSSALELAVGIRRDFWIPDGPVHAVVEDNGIIFLGGDFQHVGPNDGHGIFVDLATSTRRREAPYFDGDLLAAAADVEGHWYLGGEFQFAGEYPRPGLVRLLPDLRPDPAWSPRPDGAVKALAWGNGVLLVGGDFGRFDGRARSHLAAIDGASGRLLDWQLDADGPVNTIEVADGIAYLGGDFLSINGIPRKRTAAVALDTGELTDWHADANAEVFAISVPGDGVVYLGGDFTSVNRQPRARLASVERDTASLTAWAPAADDTVLALWATDEWVIAGGSFRNLAGQPRGRLGVISVSDGVPNAWNPDLDDTVYAVRVDAGRLQAGGRFTSAAGEPRSRLAVWNLETGTLLPEGPSFNREVRLLLTVDDTLLVGGSFLSAGALERRNLAALNAVTGAAVPWQANASGPVHALAVARHTLFAGGDFTTVNDEPAPNLAAIDLDNGTVLAFPVAPDGPVFAVMRVADTLYLGGAFSSLGNDRRPGIAAVDLNTGLPLPWNPKANGPVLALANHGEIVFAGGAFTHLGLPRQHLAAVHYLTGEVFPWNPGADGRVNHLAVAHQRVYVGGRFQRIGGLAQAGIAAFDLSPDGGLEDWRPLLQTDDLETTQVSTFALRGQTLVAGGQFDAANSQSRRNLAALGVATGATSGWGPHADGPIVAMGGSGTTLQVGGGFSHIAGRNHPFFAVFSEVGAPVILRQPRVGRQIAGEPVKLSVRAIGFDPLLYQWRRNGEPLPGETGVELSLGRLEASNSGSYDVVIGNPAGTIVSQSVWIAPVAPPTILSQPRSQIVPTGGKVILGVTAGGSSPLRYQWRRNGANIPGANQRLLLIPEVGLTDAGEYRVVVSNPAGVAQSDSVALEVLTPGARGLRDAFDALANPDSRPQGALRGDNRAATREPGEPWHAGKEGGHSVWFNWQAPADGIVSFDTRGSSFDTLLAVYVGGRVTDLNRDLVPVTSSEDEAGYFASWVRFNATAGTTYYVAVDGYAGATGDIVFNWSLEQTDEVLPRISTQPVGLAVTEGGKAAFSITAEAGDDLRYQWFHNGQPIHGATASSLVVTPVLARDVGQYYATVSAGRRTVSSRSAALEISNLAGAPTVDKLGDLFHSVAPSPARLSWRDPQLRSIVTTAGIIGTQILHNFQAATEADEPSHGGSAGGASKWLLLEVVEAGTLVVHTMGSALDTVLAIYSGSNFLNLSLLASDDNGAPDGIRSYLKLPVVPGDYLIAVDTADGAEGVIQLNWALGTEPQWLQLPISRSVAAGQSVQFQAIAAAVPDPEYQWYHNGVPISAATDSTLTIASARPGDAGNYWATANNTIGETRSEPAILEVDVDDPVPLALANPAFSATGRFEFSVNGPEAAEVVIETSTDLIHWSPLSTEVLAEGNLRVADPTAGLDAARFYRVRY